MTSTLPASFLSPPLLRWPNREVSILVVVGCSSAARPSLTRPLRAVVATETHTWPLVPGAPRRAAGTGRAHDSNHSRRRRHLETNNCTRSLEERAARPSSRKETRCLLASPRAVRSFRHFLPASILSLASPWSPCIGPMAPIHLPAAGVGFGRCPVRQELTPPASRRVSREASISSSIATFADARVQRTRTFDSRYDGRGAHDARRAGHGAAGGSQRTTRLAPRGARTGH
jgi:hypothetical protein